MQKYTHFYLAYIFLFGMNVTNLYAGKVVIEGDLSVSENINVDNDAHFSGETSLASTSLIESFGNQDLLSPVRIQAEGILLDKSVSSFSALAFNEELEDSHQSWNGTQFIAPFSANYVIAGNVSFVFSDTTLDLWKNGNPLRSAILYLGEEQVTGSFLTKVKLLAGDSLELRTNISNTQDASAVNLISIHSLEAGSVPASGLSSSGAYPIGSVISWMTETAPEGYLICDGSEVSRATYQDLFRVIGTRYGYGDGITTFQLPDLRGYFLRGWDRGLGRDPNAMDRMDRGDGTLGDNVGTKQDSEIREHTHDLQYHPNHTGDNPNSYDSQIAKGSYMYYKNSIGSAGGEESRPKNTNTLYCIKF